MFIFDKEKGLESKNFAIFYASICNLVLITEKYQNFVLHFFMRNSNFDPKFLDFWKNSFLYIFTVTFGEKVCGS